MVCPIDYYLTFTSNQGLEHTILNTEKRKGFCRIKMEFVKENNKVEQSRIPKRKTFC